MPTLLCGPAGLAKHVDHQFAKAVDDLRMPLEIGDRVDHAKDLQHTSDAVETAQLSAECGEDGQSDFRAARFPCSSLSSAPTLPQIILPSGKSGPCPDT